MPAPALRPLSAGEILDVSFQLYRRHFGPLATVALVCSGFPVLLSLFIESAGGMFANPGLTLVYYLLLAALSAVATGATVFIVSESYLGRPLRAWDALSRATPLIWRLIVCSILLAILVAIGLVFVILPGVILACGLVLAFPTLVLEPGATPTGALARSWRLTRGSRLRMFGLMLTLLVLLYIPIVAIGAVASLVLPVSGLTRPGTGTTVALAAIAIVGVVQLLVYPLFYCVLTVAYYDLRVRKEGFDLEVLASILRPA
ncbi:MAG: glycerophosphoryl diester phosphodiesterase membrane domain-containing protein [Gemmatimonadales bacterium]|nr:glycerophosphoryl diester phosphodiesterase membrane domain-containing protein [Gemmatimonadales bacterium]